MSFSPCICWHISSVQHTVFNHVYLQSTSRVVQSQCPVRESTVSNESGRSLPPGKCSANHAALATVFPGTAKLRSLPFRLFT
uniref:Uncharacterized protein n=1 Tax=Anguilla anguilla TaxID=7936 RepID=A0A0E9WPK6_ANGAN